jgi:Histidine kinase-, DNA gyrase B-, and HSP90-like ATPase
VNIISLPESERENIMNAQIMSDVLVSKLSHVMGFQRDVSSGDSPTQGGSSMKINKQTWHPQLSAVTVKTFVNEEDLRLSALASSGSISVSVSCTPDVPRHCKVPRAEVSQVLSHLVTYCVESTPAGGAVEVILQLDSEKLKSPKSAKSEDDDEPAMMLITVEDTSGGIPQSQRRDIFRSTEQQLASLPVALSIASDVGGSIRLAGRADGRSGNRFEVRVPFAPSLGEPVRPFSPTSASPVPASRGATPRLDLPAKNASEPPSSPMRGLSTDSDESWPQTLGELRATLASNESPGATFSPRPLLSMYPPEQDSLLKGSTVLYVDDKYGFQILIFLCYFAVALTALVFF